MQLHVVSKIEIAILASLGACIPDANLPTPLAEARARREIEERALKAAEEERLRRQDQVRAQKEAEAKKKAEAEAKASC